MEKKIAKISIIQKLIEKVFGKKFYICVIGQQGSGVYFVNSTIYRSMREVAAYRKYIRENNPSHIFIGYYSFRSHNDFRLPKRGEQQPQPSDDINK